MGCSSSKNSSRMIKPRFKVGDFVSSPHDFDKRMSNAGVHVYVIDKYQSGGNYIGHLICYHRTQRKNDLRPVSLKEFMHCKYFMQNTYKKITSRKKKKKLTAIYQSLSSQQFEYRQTNKIKELKDLKVKKPLLLEQKRLLMNKMQQTLDLNQCFKPNEIVTYCKAPKKNHIIHQDKYGNFMPNYCWRIDSPKNDKNHIIKLIEELKNCHYDEFKINDESDDGLAELRNNVNVFENQIKRIEDNFEYVDVEELGFDGLWKKFRGQKRFDIKCIDKNVYGSIKSLIEIFIEHKKQQRKQQKIEQEKHAKKELEKYYKELKLQYVGTLTPIETKIFSKKTEYRQRKEMDEWAKIKQKEEENYKFLEMLYVGQLFNWQKDEFENLTKEEKKRTVIEWEKEEKQRKQIERNKASGGYKQKIEYSAGSDYKQSNHTEPWSVSNKSWMMPKSVKCETIWYDPYAEGTSYQFVTTHYG